MLASPAPRACTVSPEATIPSVDQSQPLFVRRPERTPTALLFYNQDLHFFYAFRYDDRSFYFMCLNGTACLVLRLSRGYCQHTISIYAKSFMVAPFNILLFWAQL